jgi:hypothetical protein
MPFIAMSRTPPTNRSSSGAWPCKQAAVERTVDQVECHLDVRIRGDIPAVDGALEDFPYLVPAGVDDALLVLGVEDRVGPRLGDQRRDHPGVGAAADKPGRRAQQREQVAAQRAGIRGCRGHGGPFSVERVECQRFLGGPPAVDGGLAHPARSATASMLTAERPRSSRSPAAASSPALCAFSLRGRPREEGAGSAGMPALTLSSARTEPRCATAPQGSPRCPGGRNPSPRPWSACCRQPRTRGTHPFSIGEPIADADIAPAASTGSIPPRSASRRPSLNVVPSPRNSGSAIPNAFSGPPTMMDRAPLSAAGTLPETSRAHLRMNSPAERCSVRRSGQAPRYRCVSAT